MSGYWFFPSGHHPPFPGKCIMQLKSDPARLPFPITFFSLAHESRTFHFVLPADPDAVFDTITDEQYDKDRFLPYWAEQWPAATAFFSFVMKQSFPHDLWTCELGCGLGVIASVLSNKGCSVVATDIAPHGCRFAAYNIAANGGVPRVVCADWCAPPFQRQFNLIVASDVLYEARWIDPILDNIEHLLAADGRAWIADPCRQHWELFKQNVARRGFDQRVLERSSVCEGATTVEILEITIRHGNDTLI